MYVYTYIHQGVNQKMVIQVMFTELQFVLVQLRFKYLKWQTGVVRHIYIYACTRQLLYHFLKGIFTNYYKTFCLHVAKNSWAWLNWSEVLTLSLFSGRPTNEGFFFFR